MAVTKFHAVSPKELSCGRELGSPHERSLCLMYIAALSKDLTMLAASWVKNSLVLKIETALRLPSHKEGSAGWLAS